MQNEKIIWDKDGSEMVLIPAGSFEMGDHFDEGDDDELPIHQVELDAFYMDVNEVTAGQFKPFVEDSGYDYDDWDNVAEYSPGDEFPMIYVNWNDATAYAKWAGKRLPTEAEWEYAARGGLIGKRYPWGDEIDKTKARYDSWNDGKGTTAPVGSYPANGYGLYDMAGNAWEWCQDRYGENYYSSSPAKNPPGPGSGSYRVLRGGACYDNASNYHLRVAYRSNYIPAGRYLGLGFRCVSGSDNP